MSLAVAVPEHLAPRVPRGDVIVIPIPSSGERPRPRDVSRAEEAERVVILGPDTEWLMGYSRWLDPPRCWIGFWSGRAGEFGEAVASARPVPLPRLHPADEELEAWERELLEGVSPQDSGLTTGVPALDHVMDGLLTRGALVGLLGYAKSGKTTMALQIAVHNVRQGLAVLYTCLEMPVRALLGKVVASVMGISEITALDVRATREILFGSGGVLVVGSGGVWTSVDTICSDIRAAHRRYGLDLVVIDNLHAIVRTEERSVEAVGVASKRIRMLALELQVPVLLLLQPRRPDRGVDGPPSFGDVLWSSAVECDLDALVTIHRWRSTNGVREKEMLVRLELSRYAEERQAVLVLEGATSTVRGADEEEQRSFLRRRGWAEI